MAYQKPKLGDLVFYPSTNNPTNTPTIGLVVEEIPSVVNNPVEKFRILWIITLTGRTLLSTTYYYHSEVILFKHYKSWIKKNGGK